MLRLSFCLVLLVACSTSSNGDGTVNLAGRDWTCCPNGEPGTSCTCYENTENSQTGCSPSVQQCVEVDAGVGCCEAKFVDDGWLCQCWPPGATCPNTGTPVAACPP